MLNILAAEVLHEETARQCVVWHRKSRTEGAQSTWLWITGRRYRNRTAWQGGCPRPPKSWAAVGFLHCAKVNLDLRRCLCLQEAPEMFNLASKHWHQSGRQRWRIEGKLVRRSLFFLSALFWCPPSYWCMSDGHMTEGWISLRIFGWSIAGRKQRGRRGLIGICVTGDF